MNLWRFMTKMLLNRIEKVSKSRWLYIEEYKEIWWEIENWQEYSWIFGTENTGNWCNIEKWNWIYINVVRVKQ